MAVLTNNATVSASQGLGPTTYVCTVATGTVTVEAACNEIQNEGGTIVAVEGTADGSYVLVQGGPTPAVTGVTVAATLS
jgi:hypothetical protein